MVYLPYICAEFDPKKIYQTESIFHLWCFNSRVVTWGCIVACNPWVQTRGGPTGRAAQQLAFDGAIIIRPRRMFC